MTHIHPCTGIFVTVAIDDRSMCLHFSVFIQSEIIVTQILSCLNHQGSCSLGYNCPFSHGVFESWLHPTKYRTLLCKDGGSCGRNICFFAHNQEELRAPVPGSEPPFSLTLTPGSPSPQKAMADAQLNNTNTKDPMTIGQNMQKTSKGCLSLALPATVSSGNNSIMDCFSIHGSSLNSARFERPPLGPGVESYVAGVAASPSARQARTSIGRLSNTMLESPLSPHSSPGLAHYQKQITAPEFDPSLHHLMGFATPQARSPTNLTPAAYTPLMARLSPTFVPPVNNFGLIGGLPDLTQPLLAGALQAGVLDQVLAQLSTQQLAMLSPQQYYDTLFGDRSYFRCPQSARAEPDGIHAIIVKCASAYYQ